MVRLAWAIFFLFPFACTSMTGKLPVSNSLSDMQLNSMNDAHGLNQARFSILATLPWNQANGISGKLGPDAMGMGFQTEAPANVWAPVVLRKRAEGGVFVVSVGEIVALDKEGNVVRRLNWSKGAVLDVAEWGHQLLVMHSGAPESVQLTSMEEGGNEKWSREVNANAKHLLNLNGAVFVVQHVKGQTVALNRIERETGKTSNVFPTDSQTFPVFAGKEGEVCFLSYDPAANQRVWNRQQLHGEVASTGIPASMYGLFAFPASSDAQSNAYGIFGMEAGKFAVDGSANWRIKLEALVPAADGSVWTSESQGGQVKVYHAGNSKVEETSIAIPVELVEGNKPVQWRLVKVDQGAFYLSGLHPTTYRRMALTCNRKTGEVAVANPDKGPGEFGSLLQGGRSWTFDVNGDLILPIATPEALVLIKVAM